MTEGDIGERLADLRKEEAEQRLVCGGSRIFDTGRLATVRTYQERLS